MYDFINKIIIAIDDVGLSNTFYSSTVYFIIIALVILSVFFAKKLNIKLYKAIILGAGTYLLMMAWMSIYPWIESGFKRGAASNNIHCFVYTPLLVLPFVKLLKIRWLDACYIMAHFMPLLQGIAMMGCIFMGCCRGYPSDVGLYSIRWDYYYFPIQQIISIIDLVIFALLIIRAKKHNFVPDALQYPIMLTIVGVTRFVCEFFRDNTKIFMGVFSAHAFHALFMAIVGVVAIIVIKYREKKKTI